MIWSAVTGVLILVIVMLLVAPDSPAAAAVKDVSGALAGVVRSAAA